MRRAAVAVSALLVGCGAPGGDDSGGVDGACGDVSTHDVTILGRVVDADHAPSPGVSVVLEDRGWNPGDVLGSVQTDAEGGFVLQADGVTSVAGCWATLLDYLLVADDGATRAEKRMNTVLFNAIDDGTLEVDLSDAPIVLE